MAEELLTQKQLARRWVLSERTLERWRCTGEGPTYIKLGGLVRYRLADILAYEHENLCHRRPAIQPDPTHKKRLHHCQ